MTVHDSEHRRAEVAGELGVERELVGRGGTRVVAALHDHHVGHGLDPLVLLNGLRHPALRRLDVATEAA